LSRFEVVVHAELSLMLKLLVIEIAVGFEAVYGVVCHPERSENFAWRSSRGVEGPL
jgi:hypothetical protein